MALIIARMHIEAIVSENIITTIVPVAFWTFEQPNYRSSRSQYAISRGFGLTYVQD
jgi:hypothetical protein